MNRMLAAIAAAVCVAGSAPVLAQGWYGGLSVGKGGVNISAAEVGLSSGTLDDSDTSFGARIGYDFSRHFGVEAAYYNLGEYSFSGLLGPFPATGQTKNKSYNVSLVGTLPFGDRDQFAGYGKIGYARTRVSANADVIGFTGTSTEWESEAVYGLGVKYMIDKQWGLFGEWSRLNDSQIEQWMVGAVLRF